MKIKEIEGLIDFIAKSGLEEVNIETEQIKINVKRNPVVIQGTTALSNSMASSPTELNVQPSVQEDLIKPPPATSTSSIPEVANHITVKSPMIGTFYRAANPEAPPFVLEGDKISQGKTLCVIEAMKLFNEIEAEVTGTVLKVLVEDASPVEYDQPLFLIEPAS